MAGAAELAEGERSNVDRWLANPALRVMFWEQSIGDQRHAYDGARHVFGLGRPPEVVQAALLHDVGKRHAALGPIGRTLATVAHSVGIPGGRRMEAYTAHGARGADELEAAGAHPLVVSFTRHHHSGRPPDITVADWDVLVGVDHRY